MRSFQIQNNLGFMKKLLTEDVFDTFLLSEASITTFATFQIDGTFHPDYLDTEEAGLLNAEKSGYTLWKRVRPFFYELTKGKLTPLRFRIIFRLAQYNVEKLIAQTGISIDARDVAGLFLNISFDGKNIICTSGTSLKIFSPDRSMDHAWDEMLERFFRQRQILFL